jgi:hypothetical protein
MSRDEEPQRIQRHFLKLHHGLLYRQIVSLDGKQRSDRCSCCLPRVGGPHILVKEFPDVRFCTHRYLKKALTGRHSPGLTYAVYISRVVLLVRLKRSAVIGMSYFRFLFQQLSRST